jgi:hypothetical protein
MLRSVLLAFGVAVGGCCGYGGPGCGDPFLVGLCSPEIQRGSFADVEVDYGDDTGLRPAVVERAISENDTVALVAQRDVVGGLTLIGRELGVAPIEIRVSGWEHPARFELSVIAAATPACEVAPYSDPAGFPISTAP